MDISIIIVNYNTCKLTLEAIQSVYDSITNYQYEIIVIDNHSHDDSVMKIREVFPEVNLIENNENVGFSRANNQGINISTGRYVLLLNSDTIMESDTLTTMVEFMDKHKEVGASGCKVVLPDGSLDKACKRGFPTPMASLYYISGISKLFPKSSKFNQYHLGHLSEDDAYPVDCLVGAFMFVRREAIDEVGLLDEEYFMYGEDIDWCYRIKQAGWENYYYPVTKITHYKGASSRKKPLKIIYEFHRAMYLFHRKHFKGKYLMGVNQLVYFAIFSKLVMSIVKNQLRVNR